MPIIGNGEQVVSSQVRGRRGRGRVTTLLSQLQQVGVRFQLICEHWDGSRWVQDAVAEYDHRVNGEPRLEVELTDVADMRFVTKNLSDPLLDVVLTAEAG